MTFPRRLLSSFVAGALGLWMAPLAQSQEPSLTANQRVATTVADNLRQSGQLRHYDIHVAYQNGRAVLTGNVADQGQLDEALRITQGVVGVERVVNRLTIAGNGIAQVNADEQPANQPPVLGQPAPAPRAPELSGPPGEPVPMFSMPQGSPYDAQAVKMPPYAWPTYAPYNNYSRVAYPQYYPPQAFPYIGPCYPFPKVPLGWRSVKLEWEDGHWWYGRCGCQHDWWRLRYW